MVSGGIFSNLWQIFACTCSKDIISSSLDAPLISKVQLGTTSLHLISYLGIEIANLQYSLWSYELSYHNYHYASLEAIRYSWEKTFLSLEAPEQKICLFWICSYEGSSIDTIGLQHRVEVYICKLLYLRHRPFLRGTALATQENPNPTRASTASVRRREVEVLFWVRNLHRKLPHDWTRSKSLQSTHFIGKNFSQSRKSHNRSNALAVRVVLPLL